MAANRRTHRPREMVRWLEAAVQSRLIPALEDAWNNPLLRHARRQYGMPLGLVCVAMAILGLTAAALTVTAWVARWREVGAGLFAASLGAVMLPALFAAPTGAARVARQIHFSTQDPHRLTNMAADDVVWGLALVTLWRLRWLIAAGLALTPTLIVSVLHANVSEYQSWQRAAAMMGDSAAAPHTDMLRPDGSIPVFRLVVRALSAGLTPWAALLLAAALGVWAGLVLHDPVLSPLVALLIEAPALAVIGGLWNSITATPLLAGGWEIVRLAGSTVGVGAALWLSAQWVSNRSAAMLLAFREHSEPTGSSYAGGVEEKLE